MKIKGMSKPHILLFRIYCMTISSLLLLRRPFLKGGAVDAD